MNPSPLPPKLGYQEFLVAQSLKFQFKVHHSHLAARGIYLDLQMCPSLQGPTGIDRLAQAWPEGWSLTDLEFLWTPSQIACAAWWIVDKPIIEIWLKLKSHRLLTKNDSTPSSSLTLNPPIDHLNSLSQILNDTKLKPINKDRVTAKSGKDPNSNLFRIMKAQIENDSIVKHHQKYPVGTHHDPFS
ncbi:hypothetical protein PSHT_10730 [Puccinia striiformis]|uniref:Cyclin C-terminal domain-containing protein n=1 Tax=Puccinia striiformis TaxID=27350 RepID=A0A2S4V7X5_9BASI|nr:hypothetical protein PSHT_10730 [Puccinia striiformis]